MSGHTKGPWVAELGEAYNVRAPHGGIVAQIHHLKGRHGLGGRLDGAEAAANARLIAAAPDLLAAIKGLDEAYCRARDWLTREERHEDRLRLIAARAAIARATGNDQ